MESVALLFLEMSPLFLVASLLILIGLLVVIFTMNAKSKV